MIYICEGNRQTALRWTYQNTRFYFSFPRYASIVIWCCCHKKDYLESNHLHRMVFTDEI